MTYGQYKNSNLWVIGVLGGKQGENGAEKIFEGLIAENSPNL